MRSPLGAAVREPSGAPARPCAPYSCAGLVGFRRGCPGFAGRAYSSAGSRGKPAPDGQFWPRQALRYARAAGPAPAVQARTAPSGADPPDAHTVRPISPSSGRGTGSLGRGGNFGMRAGRGGPARSPPGAHGSAQRAYSSAGSRGKRPPDGQIWPRRALRYARGGPSAPGGCADRPEGYGLITVLEIEVRGVVAGDQA